MRDLLSKLDALVSETALKDKADLEAKRQALGDLESDPVARKDPEISAAIAQRRLDLEKEAKSKGFAEGSKNKCTCEPGDPDPDCPVHGLEPMDVGDALDIKKESQEIYQIGDEFGISFSEDFEIGAEITDILEDGIVINLDETALEFLSQNGFTFEEVQIDEAKKKGLDGKACWKGYRYAGTKMKGGKRVDNCVKVGEDLDEEQTDEAKYQGREVPLGKPMKGDVKKSKVYVRGPKGNVVKVNFGDKKMRIKKSNPNRRKSFRARHNCSNPGPRWKARYWSCRAW